MRHPFLPLHQAHCGWCARGRLWLLLGVLLVAALLGDVHPATAQPPNITGTWTDSFGGIWELKASGPGLSSLHASWQGGPGPHSGIRGSFDGTLSQQGGAYAYAGRMSVTEASAPAATGTMTFAIIAADKISMSYRQSNGPHGENIILTRATGASGAAGGASPTQLVLQGAGVTVTAILSWGADGRPHLVNGNPYGPYVMTKPVGMDQAVTITARLNAPLRDPWRLWVNVDGDWTGTTRDMPVEGLVNCGPAIQQCSVTRGPNPWTGNPPWAHSKLPDVYNPVTSTNKAIARSEAGAFLCRGPGFTNCEVTLPSGFISPFSFLVIDWI